MCNKKVADPKILPFKKLLYTKTMPVFRIDSYKIDGFKEHPSGHLILDLRMARTGIQEYDQGDGSVRKEMRTEEEVFSQDALDSFKGVPVTHLHPPEMINDKNTRDYIVGHIGDDVRRDGIWLRGTARVWDRTVKDAIIAGKIKEVSNGYFADFDETPGFVDGKKIDGYQRNIIGNHTALLPYGSARAGRGARIMLDSKGNAYIHGIKDKIPGQEKKRMKTVVIDGISYSYEGEEALSQAVEKALASRDSEISDLKKSREKSDGKTEGELASLRSENTDLKKEVSDLKAENEKIKDPAYLKDAVEVRSKLLEKAKEIAGKDFHHDGSDFEVKVAALEKAGQKIPDFEGKTNDYQSAYIDSLFDRFEVKEEKSESVVSKLAISSSSKKSAVNDAIDRAFAARFGKEE